MGTRTQGEGGQTHWWKEVFARWLAWLTVLAGLWCLVAIALDPVFPRFVGFGSALFDVLNLPVAPNIFSGVMLIVVGSALAVRKRAALWFVLVVFNGGWLVFALPVLVLRVIGAGTVPEALLDNTVDIVVFLAEVVAALVLIPLLWMARSAFPARLAPGAVRQALVQLVLGLAVSAGVGVVLTELFPNTLEDQLHRITWPVRTAVGLMPEADSPVYGGTGSRWVAAVIGALSTVALLWAWHVLLRSARTTRVATFDDELRVRELLAEFGDTDSLGYFATRRDKAIMFSPDGRAAIAHRIEAGVSLVSGDPVGDPASWPAVISAWKAEAREFGWALGVLSASEAGAAAFAAAGLRVIGMGDEAVLDVEDFRLSGHSMRPVRQAVNRVRRAGYTVRVRHHAEVGAAEMREIEQCAEIWRGDASERGFSMALGRLGDPADERCVLVTATDETGRLRGVLSLVPWGTAGLSLDLMRRDRESENGVTEFMVAGLVDAARGIGVRRISLNFAMFREVFSASERLGAGPVVRVVARALSVASRWWQIESLYRSNAKYEPHWRPRYLCFGDTLQGNRALIAAGVAEGFLTNPLDRGSMSQPVASRAFGEAVRALQVEADVLPARIVPPGSSSRFAKLDRLNAAGAGAYPVKVPRTDTISAIRARWSGLSPDRRTGVEVSITGRVISLRAHGRLWFAVLREGDAEIQVLVAVDRAGNEEFDRWAQSIDVGDHVSCTGEVMATHTGELTVEVTNWTMAAKCLRPISFRREQPLPAEVRIRHRHLDLITDRNAAQMLRTRATVLRSIRESLHERAFLEVETPMLHPIQGGAAARPFMTSMNAYHMDLFLRIAPELYLKRLCVGGMDRLFELNRNFRNEGVDATHNPEFTALEAYQAHADYNDMRHLVEEVVVDCARAVAPDGDATIVHSFGGERVEVDLRDEWPVVPVYQAVSESVGEQVHPGTDATDLRRLCEATRIPVPFDASPGSLVEALYGALVEPATVRPTFYTDFPVATSPLARPHRDDPRLAERWDLVAFGTELGTAYSELNDPIDQRARLTRQARMAGAGDPEAMRLDEAFLEALEYGMPPTGGLGMGIDRLVMLLTDAPIRSTLAFPFVRPLTPGMTER